MIYRFAILVLILLLNGFFAAAEVALVSVRRSRLRALADRGWSSAQVALGLLERPERLLSVTQFGVTLASLGLGWAGEDTMYQFLLFAAGPLIPPGTEPWAHGFAFGLAFLLISYAHVIVGEVVPKNLALEKADRLALLVSPVLLIFYKIAGPFVFVIERSAAVLSKVLGLRGDHAGGGHSAEELKFIIRSSLKEGHLEGFEEGAIQKILELQDYSAREIMVPRNDILSISADANLEEVLRAFEEHKYSRLPVYDNSPEKMIGVLHYKDLIRLWLERKWAHERKRPDRPFKIERYLRKPLFIPETKPLPQLLSEFRNAHTHMALVVDEFGTITGLVTLEDVLEQVVGEIADEHDVKSKPVPEKSAELEVDGTIPIRDLETFYGIEVPAEAEYETLAGFLMFRLGTVPREGAVVEHGDRIYRVSAMERNRVARVSITEKNAGREHELRPANQE